MAGIFISYRRADSDVAAGRLADDLSRTFGPDTIFRDIERLEPGEDYVKALDRALDTCVAVIAVIGPRWLTITDEKGNRRLADPNDWVHVEIHRALERQIRVIPVLLPGTIMPQEGEMPQDIKELPTHQAFELSDRHWKQELEILVGALEKIPGIAKHPNGGANAIYRPLIDDLENLQRALSDLHSLCDRGADRALFLAQLHMVEAAVAPISDARRAVSALGDASTRKDLDGICRLVESMKVAAESTEFGQAAAIATAYVVEKELMPKLRERLLSRI